VPGISGKPGLPAVELFEAAAAGRVKALWIVATNPVVSMPDSSLVREALRRAELVVVQDAHHPTETSAFADYLLPAAAWPEKQGTMTNSERRVGLVRRAVPPPGEAQPDWRIFAGLASAMGFGEWFDWEDEAAVYAEYVRLTAGRPCDVSGLTHARLARAGDGVQWPCPEAGHPGSERLHLGGVVGTPDGRAVAAVTPHREPAEPPDRDFPLILTTGRIADQWHTMTRTGKSAALRAAAGEPQLEIGPDDARVHGISDGGWVLVRSRRGELRLRAKIVAGLARGVVFAPFHWGALHAEPGAGALNATTAGAVDPISKQPELKFVAVALEPIATPRAVRSADSRTLTRLTKELLIVGSGMAGLAVAEEVIRRRAPAEWHVTLIGAEPAVPYNRIMVSQLLAGSASPEQLALRPAQWFNENRVRLAPGVSVESIDVEGRAVIDSRGRRFRYDALVLATGSRPMVPPVPGAELPHVHAFRTIADVDALLGGVAGGGRRAVVVGGGLLGLEAAAGLQARGAAAVTVVERADRLMPQQLDAGAAALLRRAIEQRGVSLRLGCSVAAIEPEQLTLDDGELLSADLVVMAAGVVPAIELARRSGLRCARGVLVDDELRTSAPDVWAVGECAEHRGSVYALWAPLAEQARIAGAVVVGEPGAFAGAATATTLKVGGIELFAGGVVDAGDGIDEVVMSDTRSGRYRRLLLDGDRLVGAILLGDCAGAPRLQTLLRTGEPIRAEAVNGLLTSGAAGPSGRAGKPDPEEIVCSCNGVTRGTLCGAIAQGGLTSVAALGEATRAGTGCGSCKGELQALISSAGNTGDHLAKPAAGTIAA
jgi:ferredoxin-nitrate reductase